jgi:hypothetical protein
MGSLALREAPHIPVAAPQLEFGWNVTSFEMRCAHRGGETTRAREAIDTVSAKRRMALETVNHV